MTSRTVFALAATLCFSIAGFSRPAGAEAPKSVTAEIKNTDGLTIGTATVTEAPKGVLLRIEATTLPNGWHGMHFHEKGDCSDPKFANAGGHVHQGDKVVHGLLNPDSNDSGDLSNVYAGADGNLTTEVYSTLVSLSSGQGATLSDEDGFAIVIHAAPDDYTTQPIGGAGARIACAAFK
jgi:Cu-Zn family superoxide dismutase